MPPYVEDTLNDEIRRTEDIVVKVQYVPKYYIPTILRVIFVHTFGLYAILNLHCMRIWTILYALGLTMWAILGVTAGVHRLWGHRTYKAKGPLRLFLFVGFALCSHVSIFNWVRLHRVHHKYPDTEADPHNSTRGFFFAHIGWIMVSKTPEFHQKKKEIDMSDVEQDPLSRFHSRYFMTISNALFLLPSLVPVLLWGENLFLSFLASGVLRYLGSLHSIMSVNSFAHMFGTKPYNKSIKPTESPIVSFFSLGEGWHNYHHTFPWDYKAAEFGDRLNMTARFLDLCAKLGLAYDLKTASPKSIAKMKENNCS